jgi:hypothetical protein
MEDPMATAPTEKLADEELLDVERIAGILLDQHRSGMINRMEGVGYIRRLVLTAQQRGERDVRRQLEALRIQIA